MRTLIAFLLLSCLCLASRAKTKSGRQSTAIAVQSSVTSIKTAAQFKRTKPALQKETIASENELIYQNITSFSLVAIVFSRIQHSFLVLPNSTFRIFRDKRNYSYHFTWSCLYPKHTFW
ncbi:hypothetical protein VRU48_09540 [Pedobacter sp. KR3-3]|uniref:Uncharacterized protein n=1 Tax=Pedobacter albus TaxID=3113905 RepID=A0ABU7I7M6_9SPHI|nr:hypothetical protein [Pedobacter sp. KR3-3]MEE1945351.1 hypothetical protein [Pedobacter sp. KR3-3]